MFYKIAHLMGQKNYNMAIFGGKGGKEEECISLSMTWPKFVFHFGYYP